MGVTIPHPESVETELITAVCENINPGTEVTIKSANNRPGMLRVTEGTVHRLPGYDIVGASVSGDHTLIHLVEGDD